MNGGLMLPPLEVAAVLLALAARTLPVLLPFRALPVERTLEAPPADDTSNPA